MKMYRLSATAAAIALLSACASSGPIGLTPNIEQTDLTSLPVPASASSTVLAPQDEIRVTVLGFEDLSRELTIPVGGSVQFPLIGQVEVQGRSAEEIAREISDRLRGRYVVDPQVTVDVLEQPGRLVTVGGQVEKPGRYPSPQPMTLMEAVATGGGTTDTAKQEEVIIFRTVEGKRYLGVYNLEGIRRGNYDDPLVYAGDIIQVGDSPALRRIKAFATIAPLITAPIILLDRILR